ncbi:MAG: hypothetical protein ACRDRE_21545 [Pseudonocardiaceae bacterium]
MADRCHPLPRRKEVASYVAHLATRNELDPGSVLKSLLHIHHIRTVGIDERCEHVCYRLARSAALAWATRNRGEPQ